MKESATTSAGWAAVRWVLLVAGILAAGALAFVKLAPLPLEIAMPDIDPAQPVDPRKAIVVETFGYGARLSHVELREEAGAVIAAGSGEDQKFASVQPLEFDKRYTLSVVAERPWAQQLETRDLSFATVAIPRLEGPLQRTLGPDGAITLVFDQPANLVKASSDLNLSIEPAADQKSFRLLASEYAQDHQYPVQLEWRSVNGVPLPPIELAVSTVPALAVEINRGSGDEVGISMPITFSFSEPVADRKALGQYIRFQAAGGTDIGGKWEWFNKNKVRFLPQPGWPASSRIEVTVANHGLKSERGGTLAHAAKSSFTTGSDKRINVFLDAQKVDAIENGQVVRTFRVSTGKAKTPTVTGQFYIYARFPTKTMKSRAKPGEKGHYVVEGVPYAQYFFEDYAFHGAWWHNSFGRPASHGCVNMSTRKKNNRWPKAAEDAGWLYQWASLGVPVTVYKQTPTDLAMQRSGAAGSGSEPALETLQN